MLDPLSITALGAGVRAIFDLIDTLKRSGQITDEQARSLMDDADRRRKAAVSDWDAANE